VAARTKGPVVKKQPPRKVVAKKRPAPEMPKVTEPGKVTSAVVDKVPPANRQRPSAVYAATLHAIRTNGIVGKPVRLATFAGKSGANSVRRALVNGDYPVDGKVSDWELVARRNAGGGSTLFATLKK
jgi:hypothetical protein